MACANEMTLERDAIVAYGAARDALERAAPHVRSHVHTVEQRIGEHEQTRRTGLKLKGDSRLGTNVGPGMGWKGTTAVNRSLIWNAPHILLSLGQKLSYKSPLF